jgi:hypothetical protein
VSTFEYLGPKCLCSDRSKWLINQLERSRWRGGHCLVDGVSATWTDASSRVRPRTHTLVRDSLAIGIRRRRVGWSWC